MQHYSITVHPLSASGTSSISSNIRLSHVSPKISPLHSLGPWWWHHPLYTPYKPPKLYVWLTLDLRVLPLSLFTIHWWFCAMLSVWATISSSHVVGGFPSPANQLSGWLPSWLASPFAKIGKVKCIVPISHEDLLPPSFSSLFLCSLTNHCLDYFSQEIFTFSSWIDQPHCWNQCDIS